MSDTLIMNLVIGGIVAIVSTILIIYIIGKLKGKIVITVNDVDRGEENILSGTVYLLTKKEAKSEKFGIYLIGSESYRDNEGKITTREIIRRFELLAPGREYKAGEENTYDFKIIVPKNLSESMQDVKTGNAKVDGVLGAVGGMMNAYNKSTMNDIKWHLKAELDIPGVDITQTERVYI